VSETYLIWKTAHLLSAAVIFGSGWAIGFVGWFAARSAIRRCDIGSLRTILKMTVWAYLWLTAPAATFQAVSGVVLMRLAGWPLGSHWSIAVWSLFTFVGVCWLPMVTIQIVLSRTATLAASLEALPVSFHRAFRLWFALGVPAVAAVVIIFYLMAANPSVTG
jgi:uncharacterized membrane protein